MMKLLDTIIKQLLDKHVGGQTYFTALDRSLQHKLITDKLFSIAPINSTVIVSGGFGRFIKRLYPEKDILLLAGGLRHLDKICLEDKAHIIKKKDFVFLDDSYYLGRTRNVIRAEISRLKGTLVHTYAVYDGSMFKDKKVTSLFRYHERF